jgi:hypothetical protein
MSYLIPTTIVDNFFEDPIKIREYALSQDFFSDPENSWPGKRTNPLPKINPNLFQHVIKKSLKIFYRDDEQFEYESTMYFQLSDCSYGTGWVHADVANMITGIIYLNPNGQLSSGTTIYQPKIIGAEPINLDIKQQSFNGTIQDCTQARNENNDQFEETIIIKNKFNRLILFDSHLYHSANDFIGNDKDSSRLTLVFFINKLFTRNFPIHRMKKIV